jgi:flagellar basal body P-ring formation protein FlgA
VTTPAPPARRLLAAACLAVALGLPAALCAQPAAVEPPTAARDLPRGHTLTAEDIGRAEGARRGTDGEAAVGPGWVTRRGIREGEPLREPAVAPPPVVRAGETVEVIWRQGGMELRARGTALGSAVAGQRVAVRLDTRRRLEGTAAAPGQVLVSRSELNRGPPR